MGMFSEIAASMEAERLKKVCWKALNSGNDSVKSFAKTHVYPLYVSAEGDACSDDDKMLKAAFEMVPEFTGVK